MTSLLINVIMTALALRWSFCRGFGARVRRVPAPSRFSNGGKCQNEHCLPKIWNYSVLHVPILLRGSSECDVRLPKPEKTS